MSNTASTTTPGHQPDPSRSGFSSQFASDPLLRGGAFIDPGTNRNSGVGKIPVKSSGDARPAAPQGATPSSSANGAEGETPQKARRSVPRPPEPGSEIASWLPAGWLVEERFRTSGATAGTVDKYYFDPTSGRRFRSKKEVQYYLETGTVRQKKRVAENSDNSSEATGSQKKKSGTKTHSVFDPSNVPDVVEWSLTNANEDAWTPSIHGKEVIEQERQGWNLEFASRTGKSSSKNGFLKRV